MRIATTANAWRCRHTALVVCGLLAACALPVAVNALELAGVLSASRVTPPARVAFSEERINPMFDEPFVLTGYVEYLGPGTMRKVIETPFSEKFLIDNGEIVIESDGENRRLSARRSKALTTLLGAIEAILSGNEEPLLSVFDCEVTGSASDWRIELTPKARRLARHLAGVTVLGDQDAVAVIRTDLEGGETHVMRLLNDTPPQ